MADPKPVLPKPKPIVWETSECGLPVVTADVLITSKFFTKDGKRTPVSPECLNLSRDSYIETDEVNFFKKYKFTLTKKAIVAEDPIAIEK